MNLTFDYYHNLEDVEFYLCNPDGRELFPIICENRHLTLRFNDISELTFDVHPIATSFEGNSIALESYDFIETRRLVFVKNIGWFQITSVNEEDSGDSKYKSVTAESYQSVLKNKGFVSEERVYCFYNENDPYDDFYDATNASSIPSVVGQLIKQLGIQCSLNNLPNETETPYEDWTITYVTDSLRFDNATNTGTCRTFKENVTYGYDWIVNDVEDAFGVVVLFDFLNKTIEILSAEEVTEKVNIVYSFNNFMNKISVSEDASEIVTVLNCNGNNCDIRLVNPTGTNYICDFSYYMDGEKKRWMSDDLIDAINVWSEACKDKQEEYENLIFGENGLKSLYAIETRLKTELQEASLRLQDLRTAQSKRTSFSTDKEGEYCGVVVVESVACGGKSVNTNYTSQLEENTEITAYATSPSWEKTRSKWEWKDTVERKTDVISNIIRENFDNDNDNKTTQYLYFTDDDGKSYCKIKTRTEVEKGEDGNKPTQTYHYDGYERYVVYLYPTRSSDDSGYIYADGLSEWIDAWECVVDSINGDAGTLKQNESDIESKNNSLSEITNQINIFSYFENEHPDLIKELNAYWIEGDYNNDNIATLEETTLEEELELARELLESGKLELSKVCQPKLSFSIESSSAIINQYEFRDQMNLLELGKVISIEKEEGVWYTPALLEMSLNLDDKSDFSLEFANTLRLDDWGYTYADLISESSSTSRQVSANWQDITRYAREREKITSIIQNPLDATLRATSANTTNQEFIVDTSGILGRKKTSSTSEDFEDEQVRMVNNTIIFTDDNWQSAKAALGKIYYKDGEETKSTYGLVGETIIGSLLMGEKLNIHNENNTVSIDKDGIMISKVVENEDGSEELKPTLKATNDGDIILDGNIIWGTDASPTRVAYHVGNNDGSAPSKPSVSSWNDISKNDDASNRRWHKTFAAGDVYGSYTYDGGRTWTEPIRVVGTDANVNYENVFNALTNNGGVKGLFDGTNGELYINADYVKFKGAKIGGWNIGDESIYSSGVGMRSEVVTPEYREYYFSYELSEDGTYYAITGLYGMGMYNSENIIIPPYHDGVRVTKIKANAFEGNTEITSVIIPNTITTIGESAFQDCTGLRCLWIGSGLTTVEKNAFKNCTGLSSSSGGFVCYAKSQSDWDNIYVDGALAGTVGNAYLIMYSKRYFNTRYGYFASLIDGVSYPCFYAGYDGYNYLDASRPSPYSLPTNLPKFAVLEDGSLYASAVKLGTGTLGSENSVFLSTTDMVGADGFFNGTDTSNWRMTVGSKFGVTSDGRLHASGADIEGTVTAAYGDIGGLKIDNGIRAYVNDTLSVELTSKKLFINDKEASIVAGSLEICHDDSSKTTNINANGALRICGMKDETAITSIDFMTDLGESVTSHKIYLQCNASSAGMDVSLRSDPALKITKSFTVSYQLAKAVLAGTHSYNDSTTHTISLSIDGGSDTSKTETVVFNGGETGFWGTYLRLQCSDLDGNWKSGWVGDKSVSMTLNDKELGEITQSTPKNNIVITGNLVPCKSNTYSIGMAADKDTRLWSVIYAQTGEIQSSDKNKKHDIRDLSERYADIFDNLRPVSYILNENTSNRTHTGFIAQDVKKSIINAGLDTQDFAGYCEWTHKDGTTESGLRYEEFISLCVDQIQKLKKRVVLLEEKLTTTE